MKIAILGTRGIPASYGGFETSAEETAKVYVAKGHEVLVYCRGPRDSVRNYEGIELVPLPSLGISSLDTIYHTIVSVFHLLLFNRNVECIHLYNAASSLAAMLLILARKNIVITLDGVEWRREKWGAIAKIVWKMVTLLSVKVSKKVVCDSAHVRDYFQEIFNSEICFIPYGANFLSDADDSYTIHGLEEKSYVIFVGRLVKEKGVDTLIRAFSKSSIDVPLVIVGDNESDPEYVEYLKGLAEGDIKFLGFRYGEEYKSLLLNSLVYVSASVLEGTSPSLLGAMGAGICCLVNEIPENRETGGSGVLYHDGSIEGLSKKMNEVVNSREVVDCYGALGKERAGAIYTWSAVSDRYLEMYAR